MSKVLVIDDTPTILAFCSMHLVKHEVHTAGDWVEANRIAHAVKPDLIVLDEDLGAFQGSYLIRAFRMFFGPTLPLVMISSQDHREASKAAGANTFLSKTQLPALPALVDRLLGCRKGGECLIEVSAAGAVACARADCGSGGAT